MTGEFEPSEEQILETRALCGDPDAQSRLWLRHFAQTEGVQYDRMITAAMNVVRPKIDRKAPLRARDGTVCGINVPKDFWTHFIRVFQLPRDVDLMTGFIPYFD